MPLEIKINPVGSIEVEEGRFYVSIREKYRDALRGLQGFSHINVFWWGNKSDSPELRNTIITRKPYKKSPDIVGIFATRSEVRPNPVLLTTAEIIRIDVPKGIIELSWIDAEKDSPVIDIKPYQPCSDRIKDIKLPHWCAEWPEWYEDSAGFNWSSVFNFKDTQYE